MNIIEMFEQSAILAVLGMTVVFAFLWVLVICIDLVGKLVAKYELKADTSQALTSKNEKTISPEHVAAITAGIIEYQKEDNSNET